MVNERTNSVVETRPLRYSATIKVAPLFISRCAYLIFQLHRLFLSLLPANLSLLKPVLTTHSTFKPLADCFDCKKRCGEF